MWGVGGSREAGGCRGHVRGGSRNNGGAGGRGERGALPALASLLPASLTPMAATAAAALSSSFPHLPAGRRQRQRRRRRRHQSGGGPRTAHAPRGLPCAPWRAPRRRREGEGASWGSAQVESLGGGWRVSLPKEAGGAEQRRARNDVSPAPPPLLQAVSVAMATAAPGLEQSAARPQGGWQRCPSARPPRGRSGPARPGAPSQRSKRVMTSETPAPPATFGHRKTLWKRSRLLDLELLKFLF